MDAEDGGARAGRSLEPQFEEITLADIVRTVHRRKVLLAGVFLLTVLGGIVATVMTDPEYEATASVIPISNIDIIRNWLASRQAAEVVVGQLGNRVLPALFPDRWDDGAQAWRGEPPTAEEGAAALVPHVAASRLPGTAANERIVTVSVTLGDPLLAKEVADAYVASLEALRPRLEELVRADTFTKHYDGTNEKEARQRSETTAREQEFWLVLDSASASGSPVRPRPATNLAFAGVLGLVLGIAAVFLADWISRVRTVAAVVHVPPPPVAEVPAVEPRRRFGFVEPRLRE